MAAGKSAVAQEIAERLEPSIHLRGDGFRRMIVNGRIDMSEQADVHALQQLMLRYSAASKTATLYSDAGFNVIYQDVVIGPVLNDVVALYQGRPLYVVVLCPNSKVIADRETSRAKSGYGGFSIDALQVIFAETPRLGYWLDNSSQSVDESADDILRNLQKSQISS